MQQTKNRYMKKVIAINLIIVTLFSANAQEKKQLIGSWELDKISFEKIETTPDDGHQEYADLFKKALLKNGIKEGYKLTEEDKETVDLMAGGMASMAFASAIEFKEANKVNLEYLQGERFGKYTIAPGSLKITWQNEEGEEEEVFDIVKINAKNLILKDKDLKITYHYSKSEE